MTVFHHTAASNSLGLVWVAQREIWKKVFSRLKGEDWDQAAQQLKQLYWIEVIKFDDLSENMFVFQFCFYFIFSSDQEVVMFFNFCLICITEYFFKFTGGNIYLFWADRFEPTLKFFTLEVA